MTLNNIEDLDRLSYLNLDRNAAILETALSLQLSQLEKQKIEITERNRIAKQNGLKVRKGFSANFHNYERDKTVYSIAENQLKLLLEKSGLEFEHEHKVKVRDINGKTHRYSIDFYFPLLKSGIEVNPLFHETYETVRIRDCLKSQLLKRKLHIKIYNLRVFFYRKNGQLKTAIDRKRAYQLIKKLKSTKLNRETLEFFIKTNSRQ